MLTGARVLTRYRCEAIASIPLGPSFWLGSVTAGTPRLALRWLRARTQHIAEQLDAPAARPAWHWLGDDQEHERALARLAIGEPYAFMLFEDTTRYTLTARPLP